MIQAKNYIIFSKRNQVKFNSRLYAQAQKDQAIILRVRVLNKAPWNKGFKGKGICKAWNKGKRVNKLSDHHKKLLSLAYKGRILVNDGKKTISVYPNQIPLGYIRGRLPNK